MKRQGEKGTFALSQLDWQKVYEYFRAYTHVDIEDIPDIYEDYVIPTRDWLREEARLIYQYGVRDVIEKDRETIRLSGGNAFEGKMIAKAYEDAGQVILYVISVINLDDILKKHSDMMETFFLEYWAVSILNTAREMLYQNMEQFLAGTEEKLTSVWSPGQSRFELRNQKALFAELQPEELGVVLDKHMRMLPLKSVSGTIGVIPVTTEETLIACDFCEHAKTCPGYKGEKYADSKEERRLL